MIDIENLTLKQINEIKNLNSSKGHPYKIGQNYFIRTVTYFLTGKLINVFEYELVFSDAAWIADTGRFYNFIKDGEANEVEPIMGNVIIGRHAIIDCIEWTHSLPRGQK